MTRPTTRPVRRVLIVEDDRPLCTAIARLARNKWATDVWQAYSIAEARELMAQQPDLMIVDVKLPDGDAFGLIEMAWNSKPAPVIVAMSGAASPEEAFRLGQLGVRAYVAKPLSVESLSEHVDSALRTPPCLDPIVNNMVGQLGLRAVTDRVRIGMIEQAIAIAEGNRSGAARLLDISRQAVQQQMRELDRHGDDDDDEQGRLAS
jgi:two-component system, response regulator RegA